MMHVTVISPEAAVFDGEADSVVAPAGDGSIGILPHHAPLMSTLGTGTLKVRAGGIVHTFHVQGGFLQVVKNSVRILVEHVQGETNAA